MLDYIIVGSGLAGIAFAEIALQKGRKFVVFDTGEVNASKVAAGVYNPVMLKRFTALQDASEQLAEMHHFYDAIEVRLGDVFRYQSPILRKFASVQEQNDWFNAADNRRLANFLNTALHMQPINGVKSPFGFGEVMQTGFVDTAKLLEHYKMFLHTNAQLFAETFEHHDLTIGPDRVTYRDITARHIIFAEGFQVRNNPWFNYLPLNGTKGELITIHAPALNFDAIVKSGVFIIPLGKHLFRVGATYNWDDKSTHPTDSARAELLAKLNELISVPFEVIDHEAGIRPTVKDRKPLIGTHPIQPRLHILNGLGTRGVMLAPYMAGKLYALIEEGIELDKSIDIWRFRHLSPHLDQSE